MTKVPVGTPKCCNVLQNGPRWAESIPDLDKQTSSTRKFTKDRLLESLKIALAKGMVLEAEKKTKRKRRLAEEPGDNASDSRAEVGSNGDRASSDDSSKGRDRGRKRTKKSSRKLKRRKSSSSSESSEEPKKKTRMGSKANPKKLDGKTKKRDKPAKSTRSVGGSDGEDGKSTQALEAAYTVWKQSGAQAVSSAAEKLLDSMGGLLGAKARVGELKAVYAQVPKEVLAAKPALSQQWAGLEAKLEVTALEGMWFEQQSAAVKAVKKPC